jgi:hypothetical protein
MILIPLSTENRIFACWLGVTSVSSDLLYSPLSLTYTLMHPTCLVLNMNKPMDNFQHNNVILNNRTLSQLCTGSCALLVVHLQFRFTFLCHWSCQCTKYVSMQWRKSPCHSTSAITQRKTCGVMYMHGTLFIWKTHTVFGPLERTHLSHGQWVGLALVSTTPSPEDGNRSSYVLRLWTKSKNLVILSVIH